MKGKTIEIKQYNAAIFDMDGVVTRTATVHAQAWKKMFDEFLQNYYQSQGEPLREFDLEEDYRRYVDGLPRRDGVRNFLDSRQIELEEGSEEDSEEENTVHGLGKRKNRYFNQVLQQDGVEIYSDWLTKARQWRRQGMKTAIVSSSRNCKAIIDKAEISDLFDTRVDGSVSMERGLKGKPDPDIFLEAAAELQLKPEQCVVFEDAISGVQAGRAGKFGLVVGVARKKNHAELKENGADVTVEKLTELVW